MANQDDKDLQVAKSPFASKTVWVGALTAILALVESQTDFVPQDYQPYLLAGAGIITIILRLLTNKPIKLN